MHISVWSFVLKFESWIFNVLAHMRLLFILDWKTLSAIKLYYIWKSTRAKAQWGKSTKPYIPSEPWASGCKGTHIIIPKTISYIHFILEYHIREYITWISLTLFNFFFFFIIIFSLFKADGIFMEASVCLIPQWVDDYYQPDASRSPHLMHLYVTIICE